MSWRFVLSKQMTSSLQTLFSIKGSAVAKYDSTEWPEDVVQTFRLNEYNLQCTEKYSLVGKRIYSRPVAKAKYEFESHKSDKSSLIK